MRLGARQHEGVALILSITAAALLFAGYPGIDLWVSRLFYQQGQFIGEQWTWAVVLYKATPWFGRALVIGAALALAGMGRRLRPRQRRRLGMLLVVGFFGAGLLVNVVLKDHSGRPRPAQVQEFGGTAAFEPVLQRSSQCPSNCSFVSGHAATGFLLLAVGALGSRRTRWQWWRIGAVAGTVAGIARISQGAHFASDIVFGLLSIWLVSVLAREVWFRAVAMRRAAARHRPLARLRR